jgi:hypothetical protein
MRIWDRNEALRELADSIAMFEAEKKVFSRFSNVFSIVTVYSKYARALTFLNVCEKPSGEAAPPVGNVYELTPDLCALPPDSPPGVVSAYIGI